MVLVKDVSTLCKTCAKVSCVVHNIHDVGMMLKANMQTRQDQLNKEVMYSSSLVMDATEKVALLEMEVATLMAGLPKTAGALSIAQTQLERAKRNLVLMEQRLSFASSLKTKFDISCLENIDKLNIYTERFNDRADSLNARINDATCALENYFNTNITQGSNELVGQKSQYFEYQKLLYSTNKVSMKDVENAYIEKLNIRKDSFITSKKASELGIKISKYNMPEFETIFEIKISINDFDKERYAHDKIANKTLKEAIVNNEELRNAFDSRQLRQIENNITPDGYTWHHDGNPPPRRMQLVDSYLHASLQHAGGYSLWCERV